MKMSEIRAWADNLPATALLDYLEKNDLNGYMRAIDAINEIINQRLGEEIADLTRAMMDKRIEDEMDRRIAIARLAELGQAFDLDAG